jgi:hypothetical protein
LADKQNDATAAEERSTDTETPVTELAHVDATTTKADAKDISGFTTEKDSSQQQSDAYRNVLDEADKLKHPDKEREPQNPHAHGPGSDIS